VNQSRVARPWPAGGDLCDTMLHMVIPALAVVGWLVDRRVPVASLR
jgi:hypothetical protein